MRYLNATIEWNKFSDTGNHKRRVHWARRFVSARSYVLVNLTHLIDKDSLCIPEIIKIEGAAVRF